jgi:hypothetical protein
VASRGVFDYFFRSVIGIDLWCKNPKVVTREGELPVPVQYPYSWHVNQPLTHVSKKLLQNQVVPLDGMSYQYCVFRNVTFKFNGTAPFQLSDIITIGDHGYTTDNPAVFIAIALTSIMGSPKPENMRGPNGLPVNVYDLKTVKKLTPQNSPDWIKELMLPNYAYQ